MIVDKWSVLISWFLFFAFGGEPAYAKDEVKTENGSLTCGTAVVTARTTYLVSSEYIDNQVLNQSLVLENKKLGIVKSLPTDGRYISKPFVKGQKVLDGAAEGWACLKADTGKHYLYVFYYCTWGGEKEFCAPGKVQWGKLFQLDGKLLTALKRSRYVGKGEDALYRGLGLGYVNAGVKLQYIGEEH